MYAHREGRQRGLMNLSALVEKLALVSTFTRRGRGGTTGHGRGGRFSNSSDDRDRLKCEHCGQSRYTKDWCWELYGCPQDLSSHQFQQDGVGSGRGDGLFEGSKPSTHSILRCLQS